MRNGKTTGGRRYAARRTIKTRKVAVLGLGYVGLPIALAAATAGHDVVGYDIAPRRLADIHAGQTGLVDLDHEALADRLRTGALTVTTDPMDLSPCEVYLICVPTPLRNGSPDLSMVLTAIDTVAGALEPGNMVILESTTWPGTTQDVVAPRLRELSNLEAGVDIRLVFSPERIDPGNRDFPLSRIPKIIGGMTRADSDYAADFYLTFLESVHIVSGPSEAELAKILENTFRHVNLALVNELAILYSESGINLREAIDAAATKPFGFMPFYPGPGVGGHCIPVDPMYLIWHARRSGSVLQLVETAEQVNRGMPNHVINRIITLLNDAGRPVRGSRVLVLGVTYKADVTDSRESSAFPIIERLSKLLADVSWHDPMIGAGFLGLPARRIPELTAEQLSGCDLVLLHTPHAVYLRHADITSAPLVLDAHGALRGRPEPNIFEL
jgi:UDP-N-acetyl-D-glucosamine dehydrogenase